MLAQVADDRQQMRQRATEPIELPDHQHVTWLNELQSLGQAKPVIFSAGGVVLEQVTHVDAGRQQRVSLQVGGLAIMVGGDAHIADEHVRKTSKIRFPYTTSWRQGFSHTFSSQGQAEVDSRQRLSENSCLATPSFNF